MMKLNQVGVFAMLLVAATVNAYIFSDMTGGSVPAPAAVRSSDTGMPADEESRIYGGKSVNLKNYPYIVSLRENGSDSDTFCAGTLIAPEYVLTSAQCLNSYLYDVYASFGSKHGSGRGAGKSEQIRVVEAFSHPEYSPLNLSVSTNDVAMLKLEKPSTYAPARLPKADGSNNKPGKMATTLGYGIFYNDTQKDILQAVDVKIISNKQCRKLYTADGDEDIVDDSIICAASDKALCPDDAGGPLAVDGVVVGTVSRGCGVLPTIYARDTYNLGFINDILSGGSTGNATKLLTAGTSIYDVFLTAFQDASATGSSDIEEESGESRESGDKQLQA